ncbi:MAG TPA: hypothetical protein VJS42_21470 [Steroidobacteraceae bacterium]|nr:hypothetical protein [Steroidobacteraceae bacterium]
MSLSISQRQGIRSGNRAVRVNLPTVRKSSPTGRTDALKEINGFDLFEERVEKPSLRCEMRSAKC